VKRGQAAWPLLAAAAGYLIGNWNAAAPPVSGHPEPTPAVALRFQEDFAKGAAAQPATPSLATQPVLGSAQFALFEPHPIMPDNAAFARDASSPTAQAAPPPASTDMAALTPAPPAAQPRVPPAQGADTPSEAVKPHPAPSRPAAKRQDILFDEAQLARIKRRLHLTADQERMWPAVAAALRNIGREQKRKAQWRGGAVSVDPNSPAVQDLRSAAIPLLMSFSETQKDEVRHLARNMGLQQLASEF
jgi:hypothetical protein